MNRKIWKALGIAVCMLALAAPRAMAKTYEVKTGDKFAEAVQEINNKSSDTKNEIVLCDDIELTSGQMLTRGETTIKSKDENRKISFKDKNAGITVTGEGTTLNLVAEGYKGTLTIDGDTKDGSVSENPRVAFVSVLEGATANMYGNVTLQNGKFAGNACVVIMGSNSAFNMDGGVIEKCSRAVIVDSGATFNMSRGEIRNCGGDRGRVSGNDGGVHVYGAIFVMSGGTISGCTANEGGGLCAEKSSTVTISGGTISGCKAQSSDKGNGGGLYAKNKSTITIDNGTISECDGRWGGGLYADNSAVTINNSTISGCRAGAGGGLFVNNGSTLNIKDGTISKCFVSDTGKGGGLYADNSAVTISGGTIKGNKAAYGGGVALVKKVKVEEPITNWTVVDNEAYKTDTGSGYIGGGM